MESLYYNFIADDMLHVVYGLSEAKNLTCWFILFQK